MVKFTMQVGRRDSSREVNGQALHKFLALLVEKGRSLPCEPTGAVDAPRNHIADRSAKVEGTAVYRADVARRARLLFSWMQPRCPSARRLHHNVLATALANKLARGCSKIQSINGLGLEQPHERRKGVQIL
jgi:hypothetical protein